MRYCLKYQSTAEELKALRCEEATGCKRDGGIKISFTSDKTAALAADTGIYSASLKGVYPTMNSGYNDHDSELLSEIYGVFSDMGYHLKMINNTVNYELNGVCHKITQTRNRIIIESADNEREAAAGRYEDSDVFDAGESLPERVRAALLLYYLPGCVAARLTDSDYVSHIKNGRRIFEKDGRRLTFDFDCGSGSLILSSPDNSAAEKTYYPLASGKKVISLILSDISETCKKNPIFRI